MKIFIFLIGILFLVNTINGQVNSCAPQDQYLSCDNGATCFTAEKGEECSCQMGWTGFQCNICTMDSVCDTANNEVCDTTVGLGNADVKPISCSATDDVTKALLGDAEVVLNLEDSSSLQMDFWNPRFKADTSLEVRCDLTGCEQKKKGKKLTVDCDNISCTCMSGVCSGALTAVIDNLDGKASMVCNQGDPVKCNVVQEEISLDLELECKTGACAEKSPGNQAYASFILLISLSIISIVF